MIGWHLHLVGDVQSNDEHDATYYVQHDQCIHRCRTEDDVVHCGNITGTNEGSDIVRASPDNHYPGAR